MIICPMGQLTRSLKLRKEVSEMINSNNTQNADCKTRLVVVDLDGTVYDDSHRRKLLPSFGAHDSDYEAYHSKMSEDGLIVPTLQWLDDLEFEAQSETLRKTFVMFLTARPEKYRAQTTARLQEQFPHIFLALWDSSRGNQLQMREEGNRLRSPEFKAQKLRATLRTMLFDELVVLDDRMDVLAALEAEAETLRIEKCSFIHVSKKADNPDEWTLASCADRKSMRKELQQFVKVPVSGCAIDDLIERQKKGTPFAVPQEPELSVSEILRKAASTAEERNGVYKDNYKMVGPIMGTLFPDGIPPHVLTHPAFHLLELIVVKLTRFAISELSHEDSIHDIMVYAGIIDKIVLNGETGQEK